MANAELRKLRTAVHEVFDPAQCRLAIEIISGGKPDD
jgi:hypothetical protein